MEFPTKVVDRLMLEDVIAWIGAGAMNIDSPDVGKSNNDDDNDVHCRHPVSLLFWV